MARPRWHYLLLFLTFLSLALAAAPTSFCKCTCFSNATIIPLDAPESTSKPQSPDPDPHPPAKHKRTCNDCNKQFCLDYHLPICQNATEDDVFTTCFQRDSTKDELVVFIFIFATGGLLIWAAVRPWVQKWRDSAQARTRYVPVNAAEDDGAAR